MEQKSKYIRDCYHSITIKMTRLTRKEDYDEYREHLGTLKWFVDALDIGDPYEIVIREPGDGNPRYPYILKYRVEHLNEHQLDNIALMSDSKRFETCCGESFILIDVPDSRRNPFVGDDAIIASSVNMYIHADNVEVLENRQTSALLKVARNNMVHNMRTSLYIQRKLFARDVHLYNSDVEEADDGGALYIQILWGW